MRHLRVIWLCVAAAVAVVPLRPHTGGQRAKAAASQHDPTDLVCARVAAQDGARRLVLPALCVVPVVVALAPPVAMVSEVESPADAGPPAAAAPRHARFSRGPPA